MEDLADEPAFELEPDRWPRVADIAERATATCCGDGEADACESKRRRSTASRERGTADDDDDGVSTIAPARCAGWTFGVETVTDAVAADWAAAEGHTLLAWGRIPESWENEGGGVPSGSDPADGGTGFLWGEREGCLDDYVWILVEIAEDDYSFMILGPTEPVVPSDSYAGHPVYTVIDVRRVLTDLIIQPTSNDVKPTIRVHYELDFGRVRGNAGLASTGEASLHLRVAGNRGGCFDNPNDSVSTRVTRRIVGRRLGIDVTDSGRDEFEETQGCGEYARILRASLSQGMRALAQADEIEDLETHVAFEGSPEVGLPRALYLLARSHAFLDTGSAWFSAACAVVC